MKKLTSIATALCMATAFGAFCAGCASEIEAKEKEVPSSTAVATASADGYKVILCPGYQYGYGSTANTVEGLTAMQAADEARYFVTNAYIATGTAGSALPDAQTARAKTTFAGWYRAEKGVVVKYTTIPAGLTDDLYLYAMWNAEAYSGGGSTGGGGGGVTTGSATVNGTAMTPNPSPANGVEIEYMITDATFQAGTTLSFTVNGSTVTIEDYDTASTGLSYNSSTKAVTVAKAGKFTLYLKYKDKKWGLYGSRAIDPSEVERNAETCVANNTYLRGVIQNTDCTWDEPAKGFKFTGNTLTIKLTEGDRVKIVKYGTTLSKADYFDNLTSSDQSAMANNSGASNYVAKKTGTYTFTITGDKTASVSFQA